MTVFVWVLAGILAFSAAGKLVWLATQNFPQRTPGFVATDCAIEIILLLWAVWVLAN
jgi:uncharacterized membrane protein YecN with MAPEG domain